MPRPSSAQPETSATAQPEEPVDALDQARATYEKAVQAYEQRRYRDAIDLFMEADRWKPNPAFSFNIGIAFEDMGDSNRALAFYRDYVRRAPDAADRPEVEERVERLEQVLESKGIQQVTILSTPAGAAFEIDGHPTGVTPWSGEIRPGFHRLRLSLEGYETEERSFDLPPRRAIDVPVTLSKAVETKVEPVPVSSVSGDEKQSSCQGACLDSIRPLAWGLTGLGLASLVGALTLSVESDGLEEASRREPDPTESSRLRADARDESRNATILAVFGGAFAVAGGVLAFVDIRSAVNSDESTGGGSRFFAGCHATGCETTWRLSF